jgi:hypothetical protein
MQKNIIKILLILLTIFTGCKDDPVIPPPPEPLAVITIAEVSCLEAWIKLELENINLPLNISLLKDSITVLQINNLTSNDTILYIDSLLPSQAYKFQSVIKPINLTDEVKSNELTVSTLAPTSQNFTWQVYSWGMHSSSEINDISIIDENNIWCVGEIYLNDSIGTPDPIAFNAAHWDGAEWEIKKIAVTYNGNETIAPLKGIFVLPTGEIIFSSGLPYLPQGNGWKLYHLWDMGVLDENDGSVDRIWGTSTNDLYFVGSKGTIVHYQNGSWTKIESGTDLNFRDIYGSTNKDTNELEIIALASNILANPGKRLLRIKNQTVETLPDSGLSNYLSTIWFKGGRKYCLGGQGYYESRTFGPVWKRNNTIPQFHITSIRGAGLNDIVLGGSFGLLMHYNGVSWLNYAYITASYFDVISSVAIKGNTIVAVGFKGSKAVVLIGKR